MADDPQAPPDTPQRDLSGRFSPGSSGNPRGRPVGSVGHATLLKRALRTAEDPVKAAQHIVDKAVVGNIAAAKFLVDRIDPNPRKRPARFVIALPEGTSPDDVPAVCKAVKAAMLAGELAPSEAMEILQVLETCGRLTAAAEKAREPTKTAAPPQPTPPLEAIDLGPVGPDEQHIPRNIRNLKALLYINGPLSMGHAGMTPESEFGQALIKWYGPDVFKNAPPGYYDPEVGEGVKRGYKPNAFRARPPINPDAPIEASAAADPGTPPANPAPVKSEIDLASSSGGAPREVWEPDKIEPLRERDDYALPYPSDHPGPAAPPPHRRRRRRHRLRHRSWMTA